MRGKDRDGDDAAWEAEQGGARRRCVANSERVSSFTIPTWDKHRGQLVGLKLDATLGPFCGLSWLRGDIHPNFLSTSRCTIAPR